MYSFQNNYLQCTFFLACIVLDQRRREARYDACLCFCYKHKESYKPRKFADLEVKLDEPQKFRCVKGLFLFYCTVQLLADDFVLCVYCLASSDIL